MDKILGVSFGGCEEPHIESRSVLSGGCELQIWIHSEILLKRVEFNLNSSLPR